MTIITREQFKQIIRSNILIPTAIYDKNNNNIYKTFNIFCESGANFLIAPTYLYDSDEKKREAIVETANVAKDRAFMCNAITQPSDKTIYSGGNLSYDEFYSCIKKEASFLYKNSPGAVMFLFGFETLAEAKYAVYAVKEVCDLPICLLLDFKNNMKLSDDFDVASSVITLQSLGISALGVMADNCDLVLDILLDMKEFASVPLFVFPGANEFITPVEYAEYAQNFVNNKCVMFGAGKGTDSRFISQIAKELWQLEPFIPDFPTVYAICGKNQICFMDFQNNFIGQNKKTLEINLDKITKISDIDTVINKLVEADLPPVCFCSKDVEYLERAVKLYPGRAAVKSDEYGEITAKEYGGLILNDEKGEM